MKSLDSCCLHCRWEEVNWNGIVCVSSVLPSNTSYLQLNFPSTGTFTLTKTNSGPESRPTWKEQGDLELRRKRKHRLSLLASRTSSFVLYCVQSTCFCLGTHHNSNHGRAYITYYTRQFQCLVLVFPLGKGPTSKSAIGCFSRVLRGPDRMFWEESVLSWGQESGLTPPCSALPMWLVVSFSLFLLKSSSIRFRKDLPVLHAQPMSCAALLAPKIESLQHAAPWGAILCSTRDCLLSCCRGGGWASRRRPPLRGGPPGEWSWPSAQRAPNSVTTPIILAIISNLPIAAWLLSPGFPSLTQYREKKLIAF